MSRDKESWGHASRVVHKVADSKSAKGSGGEWSMDRLTPKESKKTQAIRFSYTGMTIIHRNGKK